MMLEDAMGVASVDINTYIWFQILPAVYMGLVFGDIF
jgi:hypothetical protein